MLNKRTIDATRNINGTKENVGSREDMFQPLMQRDDKGKPFFSLNSNSVFSFLTKSPCIVTFEVFEFCSNLMLFIELTTI